MKAANYLLFVLFFCFGLFGFIIGVIGFFDDTPFIDALGSCVVGGGLIIGAIYYIRWITNKIKEESACGKT